VSDPITLTVADINAFTNICAVVTDTGTGVSLTSGVTSYTLTTPMTSYIINEQNYESIDLGQAVVLTDYVFGGAAPYGYYWFSGGTCGTNGPALPLASISALSTTDELQGYNSAGGYVNSASYTLPTGPGLPAPFPSTPGTYYFSDLVVDSSIGTPLNAICEVLKLVVYAPITGSLTISGFTGEINGQAGSAPLQAVVTWAGGAGPWFNVNVYSGTDYICSKDTTLVGHVDDINGTEAIMTFKEPSTPSTTTYYCAVISDSSSGVPNPGTYLTTPATNPVTSNPNGYDPLTIGPVSLAISPALTAPVMSIYPTSTEYGVPSNQLTNWPNAVSGPTELGLLLDGIGNEPSSACSGIVCNTVEVDLTWAGGTGPYYVSLWSGSSSSCATDNTPVEANGLGPFGLDSAWTDQYSVPLTETYIPPNTPINFPFASPGFPNGAWLYGNTGPTPAASTWVDAELFIPAPAQNTYYCAVIFDSSLPAPSVTYTPAASLFSIEPLMAVNTPTITFTQVEQAVPLGEGTVDTATVTWSGGTGPFIVTLYQGTYDPVAMTCSTTGATVVQTTSFNPLTGQTENGKGIGTASFTFLEPNSVATYCYYVTVTDSTGLTASSLYEAELPPLFTPPVYDGGFATVTVAEYLAVGTTTLAPVPSGATGSDTGQTIYVKDTVAITSGGNAPFTANVYTGTSSFCGPGTSDKTLFGTATTSKSAPTTIVVGGTTGIKFTPTATTTYFCVVVTDSSTPPSVGYSGIESWIVNSPPVVTITGACGTTSAAGIATCEIAAGSGTSITATASPTGTLPDYFQWFAGTSTCAAADAVTPGPPGSVNPYLTGVITSTTTYSVLLTDSSSGTPAYSSCASITITANNGPEGIAVENNPAYSGLAYVANPMSPGTGSGSLTVIDSDSNSVITTVPLTVTAGACAGQPINPAMVAVDSVNNLVYVTGTLDAASYLVSSGTITGALPILGPPAGFIVTLSGGTTGLSAGMYLYASGSFIPIVSILNPTQITTNGPASAPSGAYSVYTGTAISTCPVADAGAGYVAVVNPATNAETGSYVVGTNPQGIAVDPALGNVYIANMGDNTVWVCPLGTACATPTVVPVGAGPMMVAVDPNTHTVYVTDNAGAWISVIQINPNPPFYTVTNHPVGSQPVGVAVNPANDEVYVVNSGSGTVSVLSGFSYNLLATIKVGGTPQGIDISSGFAYVANFATGSVTVINLATNTPLSATIPVGAGAFGVAQDAENGTVLVTNTESNTVSVISLATNQVIATIVVP